MSLDPLIIALQGVGFGPALMAVQGLGDAADDPGPEQPTGRGWRAVPRPKRREAPARRQDKDDDAAVLFLLN